MFLSKYGTGRHIYLPIVKRGLVDFAVGADWTPAAGDVKISKDGGAAANVTNLPSAIAMGNGAIWDFSLTATEMQAAQIVVTVADSATKAVEDQSFIIETYGNSSAQHELDLDTPTINPGPGGITSSSFASGAINAAAIAADAIGASELATDAVTEIVTAVLAATSSELASMPGTGATLQQKIDFLFEFFRNKLTQSATTMTLFKDNSSTPLASAAVSDDGSTVTRTKLA